MILGVDFDTRAVHCVLLDEDTLAARYVPVPIADKAGSFEAARNVRQALRDAIASAAWELRWQGGPWPGGHRHYGLDGWDSFALVGIENAFHRSHRTKVAQARIQGAIIASIPRDVCVFPMEAGEWKRTCLGDGHGNARKDEVRAWAYDELWKAGPIDDALAWPQDAFDAYCIARAALALNSAAADKVATRRAG